MSKVEFRKHLNTFVKNPPKKCPKSDCNIISHLAASKTVFRILCKQAIGGKRWYFQFAALSLCWYIHLSLLFHSEFPLRQAREKKINSIEETAVMFGCRNCCHSKEHFCWHLLFTVLQFKHNYSQILSYFIFPQCRCNTGLIIIKRNENSLAPTRTKCDCKHQPDQ